MKLIEPSDEGIARANQFIFDQDAATFKGPVVRERLKDLMFFLQQNPRIELKEVWGSYGRGSAMVKLCILGEEISATVGSDKKSGGSAITFEIRPYGQSKKRFSCGETLKPGE